jgi:hypothetical protein
MPMRRTTRHLVGVLVVSLALPASIFAGDHLVTPDQVSERLQAARMPAAPRGAGPLEARPLEAAPLGVAPLASLSDAERLDLAARMDALETDPVAGASKKTWIIVGAVAFVVLLAALIVDSCKKQGAECVN